VTTSEPSSDAETDDDNGEGDEDEDDDEEGDNDDDEDDDDEDDDEEEEDGSEAEDEDVDMEAQDDAGTFSSSLKTDGPASSHSQKSKARTPSSQIPPYQLRRQLFVPSYTSPPSTLSIEATIGIPSPTAVHSIATTTCCSYLLTGSQDGYVRCYDLWSSLNGGQMLTVAQKAVVGQGEGISKGGVGRGWWTNEVDGIVGGNVGKKLEPVYSMLCEGDGLWALCGTQVSYIWVIIAESSLG